MIQHTENNTVFERNRHAVSIHQIVVRVLVFTVDSFPYMDVPKLKDGRQFQSHHVVDKSGAGGGGCVRLLLTLLLPS